MQDILWLIRKTTISTFKNYKNWLLYVGLPIMASVLAILTQGGSGELKLNVGIVNQDSGQVITLDTIHFIEQMDSMSISHITETEVNDLITSGELDAALIFPADFAQSLKRGSPLSVQIVSIKGAEGAEYMKSSLNQYIDNRTLIAKAVGGVEAEFDVIYSTYQQDGFHLSSEKLEDQSVNHNKAKQSIGYLIILMLFTAVNLSGILMKERENKTYYRITYSPISARAYVMSNIMVNLFIMMIQIAVTLLFMTQVLRVDAGIPYWTMLLLLVIFALVAISLSLMLVAFSKSSLEVSGLQTLLFIPTSVLAGCMFPLEWMPAMMQKIAYFLPQYWVMDMIGKLQLGDSISGLYVNVIILLAFALALSLVTIYKFSRNNDTRTFI